MISLFECKVEHQRVEPCRHTFRYPLVLFGFDLLQIDRVRRGWVSTPLVGYNRFSTFSLFDRDYLAAGSESIWHKLKALMNELGIISTVSRVELFTAPRFFGYVFNPVNFYLTYTENDLPLACVVEVNNTFGDKHVYLLKDGGREQDFCRWKSEAPKEFHVSPFNTVSGDYRIEVVRGRDSFDARIDIIQDERVKFYSRIRGEQIQVTTGTVLKRVFRSPLIFWKTWPRILFQAFLLRNVKKLPVYRRPNPASVNTLRSRAPYYRHRLAMKCCFRVFRRIRRGVLILDLPDGSTHFFRGQERTDEIARLQVVNYDFFTRLLFHADIGLGESFVDGDWESTDLVALLHLVARNLEGLQPRKGILSLRFRRRNARQHRRRANSVAGSRQNIHAHYDLSNDLFATFLDETMTYSGGYFHSPGASLEESQFAKFDMLIDQLEMQPHHQLLEIGTGWGSFAIRIVQRTGCRVTSVTLSEKQRELAVKRVAQAGLSDRIDVQVRDYREILLEQDQSEFDGVVSIEMLEAVGEANLLEYFKILQSLVKPGGKVGIQYISMPHTRIRSYRANGDWIQKYVFPGCFVPSRQIVDRLIEEAGELLPVSSLSFGAHYATTLKRWRDRFNVAQTAVYESGFDARFVRLWNYYLAYSEAGFLAGMLNVHQVILRRIFDAAVYGGQEATSPLPGDYSRNCLGNVFGGGAR